MSNEGDLPEAQWAADSTGQHNYRYWDGSQWTEHTSNTALPPLGPPGAEPPPPAAMPDRRASEAAGHGRHSRPRSTRLALGLGAIMGAGLVAAAGAVAVFVFHVKVNPEATKNPRVSLGTPSTQPVTTTTVNPGRPPQQVRVEVLNGSGVPGAAGMKAFALGALGYQISSLGNASGRTGSAVQCKPGFKAEAATLAKKVGAGTTVEPFPTPAPTGSTNADCVVVLGS
jgi:hypothetical protein